MEYKLKYMEIYPNINLPFYKAERSSIYVILFIVLPSFSLRNFFSQLKYYNILMVFSNKALYYNASSLLEFYVSSSIHGGTTCQVKNRTISIKLEYTSLVFLSKQNTG